MYGHRTEVIRYAEKCEAVAANRGKTKDRDRELANLLDPDENEKCLVFEDGVMKIAIALENEAMAVIWNENNNPVLQVLGDGKILRYHGEAKEFENHVESMYSDL